MDFQLTEEQQMVRDMARKFAEAEIRPKAAELDEKHEHPSEIVKQLGELKMLGIAVPEEYGGGGISNTGTLALINSTVVDNKTGGRGGGIATSIYELFITNSTISNNAPTTSGWIIGDFSQTATPAKTARHPQADQDMRDHLWSTRRHRFTRASSRIARES